MSSQPPSREALMLFEKYVANMTEKQLRRLLVESKSFENWALAIYEQALSKKRAVRKQREADQQRRRQTNAKRDSQGRYAA